MSIHRQEDMAGLVAIEDAYEHALALHIYACFVRGLVTEDTPDEVYMAAARNSCHAASIFRKSFNIKNDVNRIESIVTGPDVMTILLKKE
jgi:hypothetical protein